MFGSALRQRRQTIDPAASDPFRSAITPDEDIDFTITAGTLTSLTLNRTSGQSVTMTKQWMQLEPRPLTLRLELQETT